MKLTRSYTANHRQRNDGSVVFDCSPDAKEWPWLNLPAQHPLVIQTQNFWASVGVTSALGTRDDDKWSALTWTDWVLGDVTAGRATHGIFTNAQGAVDQADSNDKLTFSTRLFDAQDREIVAIRGKGVVFRNRNFEQWRSGSKTKAEQASTPPTSFIYAPRELLGLSPVEPPLIAPLDSSGNHTRALVTKQNGLMPGHPYFSGSGDHVNSPHLAELARQTVSLLSGGNDAKLLITHGEMDMHRYIELGTEIEIGISRESDHRAVLAISQLGRSCATLTMQWSIAT